jgi:WXXGXW repeat (2 copies)
MKLATLALVGALVCAPLASRAGGLIGIGINIGVPAPVIVREGPPPPRGEVVVAAPGPGYIWVHGHYIWRHHHWVWIRGAWMFPPQPGAVWIEGRMDPGSRAWIAGHWEVAAVPPPPPAGAEVVVASPGPGYVWIGGYWGWDGYRRVWTAPHWERPPRGRHVWVAPRWEVRDGRRVFIAGTWR